MKIKKLSQKRALFLGVSVMFLTVCILMSPEKNAVLKNEQSENEPYTITVSGMIVERDLNDLFKTSNLVAVCTIMSESDSFYVQRVNGGKEILSDQFAKVDKVIMGTPNNETIVIRLRGGTIGNRTELHSQNPILQVNKQYLLFLNKPDMGGTYNTSGDYYYVRGLYQGAFEVTDTGEFVSRSGARLTAELLEVRAKGFRESLYSSREEYLANLKNNLDCKVISQEEYNKSIARMDQYAVIIDDLKVE